MVTITEDVLEQECLLQKEFFQAASTWHVKASRSKIGSLCDLVESEYILLEGFGFPLKDYLAADDTCHEMILRAWDSPAAARVIDVPGIIDSTSSSLAEYGYTWEDVAPDGLVWKQYKDAANYQIVAALQEEHQAECKLANSGTLSPSIVNTLQADLTRRRKKTSSILVKNATSREIWYYGSPSFQQYRLNMLLEDLDAVYTDILHSIATRALEIHTIHSRVQGQKDAAKLLQSVK